MTMLSLSDFRCKWCGKLLCRLKMEQGYIEIKCRNPDCKRNKNKGINYYEAKDEK